MNKWMIWGVKPTPIFGSTSISHLPKGHQPNSVGVYRARLQGFPSLKVGVFPSPRTKELERPWLRWPALPFCHGNLRYPPKAIYQPLVSLNKALLGPYLMAGVALGGYLRFPWFWDLYRLDLAQNALGSEGLLALTRQWLWWTSLGVAADSKPNLSRL